MDSGCQPGWPNVRSRERRSDPAASDAYWAGADGPVLSEAALAQHDARVVTRGATEVHGGAVPNHCELLRDGRSESRSFVETVGWELTRPGLPRAATPIRPHENSA